MIDLYDSLFEVHITLGFKSEVSAFILSNSYSCAYIPNMRLVLWIGIALGSSNEKRKNQ